jgi:hypothetical protein
MSTLPVRPRPESRTTRASAPSAERRLRQEIAVRAGVSVLILAFNEVVDIGASTAADPAIRAALLGLLLALPYYLAARSGWRVRAQAYGRMLVDVALLTGGLYGAGGLAAAPYVAVYAIVPVYAGTVLSGTACIVATMASTLTYLLVVALQRGRPADDRGPRPQDWSVAGFNLLLLNLVGR